MTLICQFLLKGIMERSISIKSLLLGPAADTNSNCIIIYMYTAHLNANPFVNSKYYRKEWKGAQMLIHINTKPRLAYI